MSTIPSLIAVTILVLQSLQLQSVAVEAANDEPCRQPEEWQQSIVDWIRSKPTGFFHPSIQWQRLPAGSSIGPYAMHATAPIPRGKILMTVPKSIVIDSRGTGETCDTIRHMLDEHELGEGSEFYPYLDYLFGEKDGGTSGGLLPSSWSNEGQALLEYIIGSGEDDLLPRRFARKNVYELCNWAEEDTPPVTKDAYDYFVSRSWKDKMVPVLDMINHRNGHWLNVESTTAQTGDDVMVYAIRDIEEGEQLYNTYTECLDDDCSFGAIKYEYVTQHLLRDYGFVEWYPRRWILGKYWAPYWEEHILGEKPKYTEPEEKNDDYDYDYDYYDEEGKLKEDHLVIEIDRDPDTNEPTFKWIFTTPTPRHINWIKRQLARLDGLEEEIVQRAARLASDHEQSTVVDYVHAYQEALELALESKDKNATVLVTFEDYEEELQEARQVRSMREEL